MPNDPLNRMRWKVEYGPQRYLEDRTRAVFFDAKDANRRVEVRIKTEMLRHIGDIPSDPQAKKQHAIDVLVAMLEESVHEVKSGELTEIDETTIDMHAVKRRFI